MVYLSQADGAKEVAKLIVDASIVPIFGSGFTKGCRTFGASIPDGKETAKLMSEIIKKKNKIDDLDNYKFNEIYSFFCNKDLVNKQDKNDFIKKYFTKTEIDGIKRKILELDWRYAYTINIDDGIDRTKIFTPVLPYRNIVESQKDNQGKQKQDFYYLYKLHGDAVEEVVYNNPDNIVFTYQEYIKSLTSEYNKTLLNLFKGDYSGKNIIFIGCSLIFEPDITQIYNMVKEDSSKVDRIILRTEKLNILEETRLINDFGINKVIVIEDYDDFYGILIDEHNSINKNSKDYKYINPQIKYLDDKETSIKYFLGVDIFNTEDNYFNESKLTIERTHVKSIIEELDNNDIIAVVGRRFSGKTAVLMNICKKVKDRPILFFPSNKTVDGDVILNLINYKEKSLFIFDTNSINRATYNLLIKYIDIIKKLKNKIIMSFNSNDSLFAINFKAKIIDISHYFDNEELNKINKNADRFGLIRKKSNNTNFDYLINLSYEQKIKLPMLDNVDPYQTSVNENILILLLSIFDKVYTSEAIAINIDFKLMLDFVKKFNVVSEIVYTDRSESFNHSCQKLVHNSKIYFLDFIIKIPRENIIECIKIIVKCVKNDKNNFKLYREIISFDNLNQLFGPKRGAGNLISDIYAALEEELSYNEFRKDSASHYWLQRAKSIYQLLPKDIQKLKKNQDNIKNLKNAYQYAKKAYYDDNRRGKIMSALTLSLISGLLYLIEINDLSLKLHYQREVIEYAYESVLSDMYIHPTYLSDTLNRRNEAHDLIINACKNYIDNQSDNYSNKAIDIICKLEDVKRIDVKRYR